MLYSMPSLKCVIQEKPQENFLRLFLLDFDIDYKENNR